MSHAIYVDRICRDLSVWSLINYSLYFNTPKPPVKFNFKKLSTCMLFDWQTALLCSTWKYKTTGFSKAVSMSTPRLNVCTLRSYRLPYHIYILEFPSVRKSVSPSRCSRLTFYWKELRPTKLWLKIFTFGFFTLPRARYILVVRRQRTRLLFRWFLGAL
jgi:hypothetical protein